LSEKTERGAANLTAKGQCQRKVYRFEILLLTPSNTLGEEPTFVREYVELKRKLSAYLWEGRLKDAVERREGDVDAVLMKIG